MEKFTPVLIWGQDIESAYIIDTEEKANEVLKKLHEGNFDLPDNIALGNWARLNVYLKDENDLKWNGTITPSMFPFFYDLQKTINKAYAKAKYGDKKYRLSREERESLEIIIHVAEGSSNFFADIPWREILGFMSGMSNNQKLTIILALIVSVTGYYTYSAHLDAQVKIATKKLQSEETKLNLQTMQFLAEGHLADAQRVQEIVEKNDILKDLQEDTEALNREKTKIMTKADIASVSGVTVPQTVSRYLSKAPEIQKEGRKIDGTFKILAIYWDSSPPRIRLQQIDDKVTLDAEFDPLLLRGDEEIIKDAEWDKKEKYIFCKINAYVNSKNKIEKAFLVEVYEEEEKHNDQS